MGWIERCGLDKKSAFGRKIVLFCSNHSPCFYYVVGLLEEHAIFVNGTLYIPYLSYEDAKKRIGRMIKNNGLKIKPYKKIDEVLKLLKNKVVETILSELPTSLFKKMEKIAREVNGIDEKIMNRRVRKNKGEIKLIKKACIIAKDILNDLDPFSFKNEKALYTYLVNKANEVGDGVSFKPIVASNENSAFPHHIPTKKKISDLVLVDFGIRYKGYCSDLTRMWFGKEGKAKKMYERGKEIVHALVDHINDGNIETNHDLTKEANKLCKQYGFWPMIHAIGHGIGIDVHERPFFGNAAKKEKLKQCVFTIEPGYYGKNWGIRYEDMVYVDKKGRARIL
jgi:Xaa-Pro dipeptidase